MGDFQTYISKCSKFLDFFFHRRIGNDLKGQEFLGISWFPKGTLSEGQKPQQGGGRTAPPPP